MTDRTKIDPPSATQLFLVFCRIGLTSFGGGISAWMLRIFVQERRWLSEEEFLNGLALSQALPGVNVTNMAIWIGYRLRGGLGACVSLFAIIFPAAILIILIAEFFSAFAKFELTHLALEGAAAAAIGMSLSIGLLAATRVPRRVVPIAVMVATFVAIALLKFPLIPVVLIGSPISIILAALKRA